MLEPSNTEPTPAESAGAHASLLDGTVVDPAELSELVGIFRAVLPDSTDDEARRGLHADVVQGTEWRFSHLRAAESCSPNYSRGAMHEDSTLHAPIANVMSAPCNSGW